MSVASRLLLSAHLFSLSLLPYACIGVPALLAAYCLYNFFLHPLSSLPGPLSARLGLPFTRLWPAWRKDYPWRLKALHDKYGMTVRTGSNSVSTIDPAAVGSIYSHGSKFHKSEFYLPFAADPNNPTLFTDINPHSHAIRRRAVARVYSMNSITKLESCIEPVIKLLFDFFDSRIASSPGKVNLSVWLRFFASDAVGKLAFGSNFNFLVLGSDPNRLQLAFLNLSYMGCVAGTLYRPFSTLAVRLMWRLSEATPKVIREAATAKTNERFEQMRRNAGGSDNEDMLSGFIACKRPKINEEQPDSKEGNDTLTRKEVAAQASSVFGAGSDTTSGALNGFFYCILKHPRVYAKLMKEVDETYAELGFGPLDEAQDEASALKYAQGVKMEYFQACLKESLRLVTPIGMEMPRVVPEDGLSVIVSGGSQRGSVKRTITLTKGVTVGTSAFVYHRTEGAYGNDAAEFRPERWLGLSEEDRAIMERNFLTFGAGSTACIGRNISLMEITKVIPPLLHRYWFRIPSESPRTSQSPRRELSGEYSPNAPWSIRCHWLFETDDFWVEISRRNPH